MHTLTHNMFHAIYATAKILQKKGKGEKQGCGRYILVIFRKKKSNLEVVLLLLVLLAHI